MKRSLSSHLVLSVFLGFTGMGFAATSSVREAEPESAITARVYNYAEIPGDALSQAKKQASRILARAGVRAAWVDCAVSADETNREPACSTPPAASDLVLKLLPPEMAKRLEKRPGTFGFALPVLNYQWLGTAFIFVQEAERLAYHGSFSTSFEASRAVVLGHLIAHEIGHLLLGPDSHARSGIMSFPWSKRVLKRLGTAHLAFSRPEVDEIRERLGAADDFSRQIVVGASQPD